MRLREPPPSLKAFPRRIVNRADRFFRVSRRGRGAWWFGSDHGRFDLPAPRGTCYLANQPLTALIETIPDGEGDAIDAIDRGHFAGRVLHRLHLPGRRSLAHLASRKAAAFGVTNELATTLPYDLPRRWALAFAGNGLGGVWYRSRPDLGSGSRNVAVFGQEGEAKDWPTGEGADIDDELIERFASTFGITVLDRFSEDDFPHLPDPPASSGRSADSRRG